MSNFLKNIDLFSEPDDNSKWSCFSKGSVETVRKIRDKQKESKDFVDAQNEITKDVLPKQSMADDKMKMTPTEAFIEVFPKGNAKPFSAALKPLEINLPAEPNVKNLCNSKEAQANIGANIGSLIEKILIEKNMNTIVDWSENISQARELQVLNKPFRTPSDKTAYAVYTKNADNQIIRLGFNACVASDPLNLGPTWESKWWGAKVDAEAAAKSKEETLSDFWNFYTEKVTNPKKDLDWDGKTFHRQSELIKRMPSLVNSKPSYEDETVMNRDKNTTSSSPVNPLRAAEQAQRQ